MTATIGQAVQRSRDELGLSIPTLAQQVGVSEAALADLEAGKGNLAAHVLMRLARAMGLPSTAFLTGASAMAAKPAVGGAKFFHSAADAPVLTEAEIVAVAREVTRSNVFADLATPQVRLDDYKPTKPGGKPWQNGYDLAASLRSKLRHVGPIQSVQRLLEEGAGILVARHAFADPRLRAMAVRAAKGRLVVVSRRLSTASLRISLVHELCHHLCDLLPNESIKESDDADLEGPSATDAKEEQRAKAFAVMFLAPSALVREHFGPPSHELRTERDALSAARRLAALCGISTTASLWHLFHLNYLSDLESEVQVWQRHVSTEPDSSGFEPSSGEQDGLLRAIEAALAGEEIDLDQAERLRSL